MLHGGSHEAVRAGVPGIVGARRARPWRSTLGAAGDDEVGITPANIDRTGAQWGRLDDLRDIQRAQAIQTFRQRSGKTRRHVLGDQDRPRKILAAATQQNLQRRWTAG